MRTSLRIICVLAFVVTTQVHSDDRRRWSTSARIFNRFSRRTVSAPPGGAAPADLRMDSPAALLQGGVSGKVIVAGHAQESLLVKRITNKTGVGMPPTGPLSDEQIALIISLDRPGSADTGSSVSLGKPPPHALVLRQARTGTAPRCQDGGWSRNTMNRFMWRVLRRKG